MSDTREAINALLEQGEYLISSERPVNGLWVAGVLGGAIPCRASSDVSHEHALELLLELLLPESEDEDVN